MIRTIYLKLKVSSFALPNNLLDDHSFLSSSSPNENDYS